MQPLSHNRLAPGSAARWRGLAAAAFVALAACVGGCAIEPVLPWSGMPDNPWMREHYIVVQKNDDSVTWETIFRSEPGPISVTEVDKLGERPIYLLATGSAEAARSALRVLRREISYGQNNPGNPGRVVSAQLNRAVHAPEFSSSAWRFGAIHNSVSAIGIRTTPADSKEDLRRTFGDALLTWAETRLRRDEVARLQAQGREVKVAVLDTGVDPLHPMLVRRLGRGFDFVDRDSRPEEIGRHDGPEPNAYGHGTHVASVIAQLAPTSKILPVRVLNGHGRGTLWTVLKGLAWAAENKAEVINLSLGTEEFHDAMAVMMKVATCDEALLDRVPPLDHSGFMGDVERCGATPRRAVAVAGEGNNSGTPLYPSALTLGGLVAVAASESHGALAEFSSRGATGELAAPGQWILGAYPGGRMAMMSGTSMAAPWVSGTAAMLLSQDFLGNRWTPRSVIQRMRDTARPLCAYPSVKEIDPLAAFTGSPSPTTCP